MKFATKPIWHCPPHLRHVAALPWVCRCGRIHKQIAFL